MNKTQILAGALLSFPALAPFLLDRMRQGLLEVTEEPVERLGRLLRAQRSLLNFSLCLVTAAFLVAMQHQSAFDAPDWRHLGSAAFAAGLLAGWCAGGTLYVYVSAEGQWNGSALPKRDRIGRILGTTLSTAAAIACTLLLCDAFWHSAAHMGERLLDYAPLMLVTLVLMGMLWGPALLATTDGPPLEAGPLLQQIVATAASAGIPLARVLIDEPDGDPALASFQARGRSIVLNPRVVDALAPSSGAALACNALAELETRVRWEQTSRLRAIMSGSAWLALWSLILTVAASVEEGRGIYSPSWLALLLAGASLGLFLLTTLVLRRRRIALHRRAAELAGGPGIYLAAQVQAVLAGRHAGGQACNGASAELSRGARRHLQSLAAILALPPDSVSNAWKDANRSGPA